MSAFLTKEHNVLINREELKSSFWLYSPILTLASHIILLQSNDPGSSIANNGGSSSGGTLHIRYPALSRSCEKLLDTKNYLAH